MIQNFSPFADRPPMKQKIREDFNLKAGTQIQIEENEKSMILTPVHGEPSLRIKDGVLSSRTSNLN